MRLARVRRTSCFGFRQPPSPPIPKCLSVTFTSIDGKPMPMSEFKGKTVLS